tara:strand:+ start:182 stop:1339 length:1158 start_codon:yes stop_codon:yes gene_type:complete
MDKVYKLLVIGGGISSCTLVSSCIQNGFKGDIAIIEAGRNLGGRCSSRFSLKNKGSIISHGAPNFNIINEDNNKKLYIFINQLLINKLIRKDNSLTFQFDEELNINNVNNNIFYKGDLYMPVNSMFDMAEGIVKLNNSNNQIDFYFQTMIKDLRYIRNQWILTTFDNRIFKTTFLVLASNLLIHPRIKNILNLKYIPLRKAIEKDKCKVIDEIIYKLNYQKFIKRTNFLIYTKEDYSVNNLSEKRNIHFLFNEKAEENYGIERIIFQHQEDNKLSIVIHTKDSMLVRENNKEKDNQFLKKEILKRFNIIFKNNSSINELFDYEDITIMNWRASQPDAVTIPKSLQISEQFNIGFCGDWFEFNGFGRVEGAITSALELSDKIRNLI